MRVGFFGFLQGFHEARSTRRLEAQAVTILERFSECKNFLKMGLEPFKRDSDSESETEASSPGLVSMSSRSETASPGYKRTAVMNESQPAEASGKRATMAGKESSPEKRATVIDEPESPK